MYSENYLRIAKLFRRHSKYTKHSINFIKWNMLKINISTK